MMLPMKFFLTLNLKLILIFFLVLIVQSSCTEKKNSTELVTNENVKEVLTRYGQAHKESEVIIETSFGNMKIRLYEDTPLHRANFIKQISEDYYAEGTFYRIVNYFMIQGGVVDKELNYLVPSEMSAAHFHKRGALAMARFDEGNPDKASSPTEFYIVQGQRHTQQDLEFEEKENGMKFTPEQKEAYTTLGGDISLDGNYTVFGEVVEGFEVIDKIAAEKVHQGEKPLKKIPFVIRLVTTK